MAKPSPYLMVSLEDSESKALAQVLSNDTSRQIMKHMSEHDKVTESELGNALGIPLSTVHYNMQNLMKAKLIEAREFHYSPKGKEVLHYSLSNKIIVIAPKSDNKRFLKKALPVLGMIGLFTAGVAFLNRLAYSPPMLAAHEGLVKSAMLAEDAVAEASGIAPAAGGLFCSVVLWFGLGALLTFGIYALFDFLYTKK
jgi:DNA-binding transcriptional ArsR family regulator